MGTTPQNTHLSFSTTPPSRKMTSHAQNDTENEKENKQTSTWYKNIVERQKRAHIRTKKQNQSPKRNGNTTTFNYTNTLQKDPPTDPLCNVIRTTHTTTNPTPQYSDITTKSKLRSTAQNYHERSTLTNFPFFSRQPSTMTVLSKPNSANHQHPTMSTILTMARSISAKVTTKPIQTTPTNLKNHTDWQNVTRKEYKVTRYELPKLTPSAPIIKQPPSSDHQLPLTLRIKAPTLQNGEFDKHRILVSFLHAFQAVDPSANILPKLHTGPNVTETAYIHQETDVPTSEQGLAQFLELQNETHTDTFCARIILASRLELHQYKNDRNFTQWLKNEDIQLNRNPISTTLRPKQVGFFTHMIARDDQTKMYEHRIQSETTDECPPFLLQTSHIKIGNATAKVWKIYANISDIATVTKEIKDAYNTPQLRVFYTWQEYNSLCASQKLTIIQTQNKFHSEYRSLLIRGFHKNNCTETMMWDDNLTIQLKDGEDETEPSNWSFVDDTDDIMMQDECIHDRFHNGTNLTKITISNFIQQCFNSGDGTYLFEHVYAPILGTREVLIKRQHIPEALSLLETIHVELCRIMNHTAIIQAYEDIDNILQQTTVTEPWKPFDIQAEISKANANENEHNFITKRQKRTRKTNTQSDTQVSRSHSNNHNTIQQIKLHHSDYPSYCSVANSTTTTSNLSEPTTNINTNSNRLDLISDTVSILRSEIQAISQSLTTLDTKVNNNNNIISTNLQQLEIAQQERIHNIQHEHNNQIQELGDSLLSKIQGSQSETHDKLASLFENQEQSFQTKLQESFQNLIMKFQPTKEASPTRKKQSTQHDDTIMTTETQNQTPSLTDDTTRTHMNPISIPITNPYSNSNLRRRSVIETLPTNIP
jgi:hypothetical protein